MRQPSVTPATRAAASTTGFTLPSAPGGVTSTISLTPATRAHAREDLVHRGRHARRRPGGRALERGHDRVHAQRAGVERADHRDAPRRARMSSISWVTAPCSVFIEARLTITRAVERVIS